MTTALSPNLAVLMFGWSLLEGIGAALIMPAFVALVVSNFDRAERPRAYGIVAAFGAIAVAVGPVTWALLLAGLGRGAGLPAGKRDCVVRPRRGERGQVQLGGGVPFISDAQLQDALNEAGVNESTATAVMSENEESRLAGLRASLAALAVLALAALLLTRGIPEAPAERHSGAVARAERRGLVPAGLPGPTVALVLNG